MSRATRYVAMRRQMRHTLTAVASTLFLIIVVALVYSILERSVLTLDMTEGRRFTLSEETREVLRRIDRAIQITGFYSARLLPERQMDDAIFRLYEVESDRRIRRQYIDPGEQPELAEAFDATEDGTVFISFLNADGTVDFSTLARVPRSSNQERDLTRAIADLLLMGEQIGFAPQAFTTGLPLVFVSGQTLDTIALVTVVLMPGAVLLAGLAVWRRRVRR